MSKIDDLENRGRSNNLIFHGVLEKAQGSSSREDVAVTLQEVLKGFVGLSASDYKIDRCHRTPTLPPSWPQGQASDIILRQGENQKRLYSDVQRQRCQIPWKEVVRSRRLLEKGYATKEGDDG